MMWHSFLNIDLPDYFQGIKSDMDALFQLMAATEGLTMLQMRILFEIKCSERPTIGSLSKLMAENHGNCSNQCKKLETAGFINRIRSKEDERIVTLQLTLLGEHAIEVITRKLDDKIMPILEATPPEKLETMLQGMQVMKDLLQQFTAKLKEG